MLGNVFNNCRRGQTAGAKGGKLIYSREQFQDYEDDGKKAISREKTPSCQACRGSHQRLPTKGYIGIGGRGGELHEYKQKGRSEFEEKVQRGTAMGELKEPF